VQQCPGHHGRRARERDAVLARAQTGYVAPSQGAAAARGRDRDQAGERRGEPDLLEQRQHHRSGERHVVREEGQLQVGVRPARRERRPQGETLEQGMHEEGDETDLGRHPRRGQTAPAQEARADAVHEALEQRWEGEACKREDDHLRPQRRNRLGQEVEENHRGSREEREHPRPREQPRMAPGIEGQRPTQGDGADGEHGGARERGHALLLQRAQTPRSSRK
jgi:hypothetical protein